VGIDEFVSDFLDPADDLSTEKGFQWQFCCPRCGEGHLSSFEYYDPGTAGLLAKSLKDTGMLGQLGGAVGELVGKTAYEAQRRAHREKALRRAVLEARLNFEKCGECLSWSCRDASCWNADLKRCVQCATDGASGGPASRGGELPNDPFLMQDAMLAAPPARPARRTTCQWCGAGDQPGETCNRCGAQL
jgi:hypothetical protein